MLQIIFSTIINRAAVEIEKMEDVFWGLFKEGVFFFFLNSPKVLKKEASRYSEEILKKTLNSLSFWRTYWTLPATILPHTQSAKLLYMPHCAVSHPHIFHQVGYYFHTGKKVLTLFKHRLSGFIGQKLCATTHLIHLDVSVWSCNQSCGPVLISAGENESPYIRRNFWHFYACSNPLIFS